MLVIRATTAGEMKIEASGYPGESCRQVTGYFLAGQKYDAVSDTPTAEAQLPAEAQATAGPIQQELSQ